MSMESARQFGSRQDPLNVCLGEIGNSRGNTTDHFVHFFFLLDAGMFLWQILRYYQNNRRTVVTNSIACCSAMVTGHPWKASCYRITTEERCALVLCVVVRGNVNENSISRVPDQNGLSLLYIMLEMHHSGRKPSICRCMCLERKQQIKSQKVWKPLV